MDSQEEKRESRWVWVVLFLVAVAAGVGVYFYYRNNQEEKAVENTEAPPVEDTTETPQEVPSYTGSSLALACGVVFTLLGTAVFFYGSFKSRAEFEYDRLSFEEAEMI